MSPLHVQSVLFLVICEHLCVFVWFCVCVCVCRWRGEGRRNPQALPPIYLSQETPPPKDKLLLLLPSPAASRETAHSSVSTRSHTITHILYTPECTQPNIVVWFTCSGVKAPSLRAGLRHQILPLTGHMTPVSLTDVSVDQWDDDVVPQWQSERLLFVSLHFQTFNHVFLCFWCVQTWTWTQSSHQQRSWVIQRRRGLESQTAGLARRSSHQWEFVVRLLGSWVLPVGPPSQSWSTCFCPSLSHSLPCPRPIWTPLQWRTGRRRTERRRSRRLSPDP